MFILTHNIETAKGHFPSTLLVDGCRYVAAAVSTFCRPISTTFQLCRLCRVIICWLLSTDHCGSVSLDPIVKWCVIFWFWGYLGIFLYLFFGRINRISHKLIRGNNYVTTFVKLIINKSNFGITVLNLGIRIQLFLSGYFSYYFFLVIRSLKIILISAMYNLRAHSRAALPGSVPAQGIRSHVSPIKY